jgi:hypothetical protein
MNEPAVFVAAGIALVLAAVMSSLGVSRGWMQKWFDLVSRRPVATAVLFGVCWWLLVLFVIWRDGRVPQMSWHDEFSFLTQAQILASGKLWLPPHPMADFFDTFHLLTTPIYAGKHYPGLALLYVPGIWMGLPYWVTTLVVSSMAVGVVVYLSIRVAGPWASVILPVVLTTSATCNWAAQMMLPAWPSVLWIALCWALFLSRDDRRTMTIARVMAIGLCAGMAMLTRPPETLILLSPLAVLMLIDGYFKRSLLKVMITGLVGFAPALAIMLAMNHAASGSWSTPPWVAYANVYQPGEGLGFTKDPESLPTTLPSHASPAKQHFWSGTVRGVLYWHRANLALGSWFTLQQHDRLWKLQQAGFNHWLAVTLLPVVVMGLFRRRGWLLLGLAVAMCGIYTIYSFTHPLYMLIPALLIFMVIANGMHEMERHLDERAKRFLQFFVGMWLLTAIVQLYVRPGVPAGTYYAIIHEVRGPLAASLPKPALLLISYDAKTDNPNEEMVYNVDTANPDDAPLIYAHDLPGRREEIIAYYAKTQPERRVFLLNRTTRLLLEIRATDSK